MPWSSLGSAVSGMTTELNALASGARALAATIVSSNTNTLAEFRLNVTFSAVPAANAPISLFILPSIDGTTYADGSSTVDPAPNLQVATFYAKATTSAQVLTIANILIPPGNFKILIRNDTGQSFAATGNTLSYAVYDSQLTNQFDQTSAPSSPSIGTRWRERDGNNKTIGDWEWNGSLWVTGYQPITVPGGYTASANNRGIAVLRFPNATGLLIENFSVYGRVAAAHSSSNYLTLRLQNWNFANATSNIGSLVNTQSVSTSSDTGLTLISSDTQISFVNLQSLVLVFAIGAGTPSNFGYNSSITARFYR